MNEILTETTVDVRALPPRERHPLIFNTWETLGDGGAILLVNDHDPVPLYYQFACENEGGFHWEYLEQGPEQWRVRIKRGRYAHPGFVPASRSTSRAAEPAKPAEPITLDVRPIFANGGTPCTAIDEAAALVAVGQSLVLLVPFEPVPLYAKLGRQGFVGAPEQLADGTWRIEFKRGSAGEAGNTEPVACGCGH